MLGLRVHGRRRAGDLRRFTEQALYAAAATAITVVVLILLYSSLRYVAG